MQILINGLKVKEWTGVVKQSVQQWLKEKPRKNLARETATGNRNTSMASTTVTLLIILLEGKEKQHIWQCVEFHLIFSHC